MKVVKNKAYFKRYQVKYRRRRGEYENMGCVTPKCYGLFVDHSESLLNYVFLQHLILQ